MASDDQPHPSTRRRPFSLGRWLPLAVLAAGLVAFFAFGLDDYLTLEVLREHRADLAAWVRDAPLLASLLYVVGYALAVAGSVPGAIFFTIAGGFLFGVVWGSVLAVIAATTGAIVVFLAARTAIGDLLRRRAGPWLGRMESGIRRDGFNYLLVLRLLPIAPFWLVNLAPALFGVRFDTYVLATLLGIIPGTVIFASVGNGLGATLDAGGEPDLGIILDPEILLPLIGLALLSLLPVVVRRLRRRKDAP